MALSSKVGTFTTNTVTGNQAITGVGFQPKIVFIFATQKTAAGASVDMSLCFGVGVSSTSRAYKAVADRDAQTTTEANTRSSNAGLFAIKTTSSPTVLTAAADLVTLDSDGFTFNLTTAPGTGIFMGYLALGGTDIANVATGVFNERTGTGSQAVTGVGFQPDAILLFHSFSEADLPTDSGDGSLQIGFGESSTKRATV